MNAALFCSLLFTGLAMAAGFAHAFELPNKIGLDADDYLTVQQIYRGWALLGIVVYGALFSTLTLAAKARRQPKLFRPAFIAVLSIVAAQAIFWTWTYPANRATNNWTFLPSDWLELRNQWEYSHTAGAVLHLIAFLAVVTAALRRPVS